MDNLILPSNHIFAHGNMVELQKILQMIFPLLLISFTTTKKKENQARIPFLCNGVGRFCWGLNSFWLCCEFLDFWILSVCFLSEQFSTLDSVLKSQIPKEKTLRKYITFFTLFMKN